MTLDLNAIKQRVDAATEGPWGAEYSYEQGNCVLPPDATSTREAVAITRLYDQVADAEFIAHARTDVPALVAGVERLRGIVERVRELHVSGIAHNPECPCGIDFSETPVCQACGEQYPCPTILALEVNNA